MSSTSNTDAFRLLDFDAYLFDIDGTLLNSRDGVHYHAFHSALRNIYGCELTIESVQVHGNTDIGILRDVLRLHGISDQAFRDGLQDALTHMGEQADQNKTDMRPEICPGIRELLALLAERNKLLGIVSGNLEPIGWRKLEAAGIRQYFTIGSFSDRNDTRPEIYRWGMNEARRILGPDARVCFIGDTPADIRAARALNTPIIAVATGIYSADELGSLAPDLCLTCFQDVHSG